MAKPRTLVQSFDKDPLFKICRQLSLVSWKLFQSLSTQSDNVAWLRENVMKVNEGIANVLRGTAREEHAVRTETNTRKSQRLASSFFVVSNPAGTSTTVTYMQCQMIKRHVSHKDRSSQASPLTCTSSSDVLPLLWPVDEEWNYLQRVVPHCGPALLAVEKAIAESFLPKLFGCEVSPAERSMCELPIKLAGLGVVNPSTSAPLASYELSRNTTAHLVNAITGREEFDSGKHLESVQKARTEARSRRETESTAQFEASVSVLGNAPQRSLRRAKEFSTGAWLSAMPKAWNDTILSAEEFRDGLAMRYSKPLQRLPGTCDGCGKAFSLDHGLNCPNGGNVIRRHNEVRDVGQLASTGYSYRCRRLTVYT